LDKDLITNFNNFIYEKHTKEAEEIFNFSYPEMAEWWVEMISQILANGKRPDGSELTRLDKDKAKETIKRIEFEINVFQENQEQE
jgi:hypothetical protein